jgi:hypothetical protein
MQESITARPLRTTLEITIHRADGSIEELGVVGYWHRNPLRRLGFRIASLFRRVFR